MSAADVAPEVTLSECTAFSGIQDTHRGFISMLHAAGQYSLYNRSARGVSATLTAPTRPANVLTDRSTLARAMMCRWR